MAYNGNGRSNRSAPVSEWKIKEQMCDIGRRIWLRGFCAGNDGNHSYRMGENRVLCTPTGMSKGVLKPDDLCLVDMDGKQVAGTRKRTSEIMMHLAIYKARPDVKAVVHSHPPHATAFAVAGIDLPTCIHPEAEYVLGAVRTAKYATPGDQRLAETILPYVKDSNTILLQSHGVVCFNAELEQAYYQLEIVDAYARLLILAKQVGSIRPMEPDEVKELLDSKQAVGLRDPRLGPGSQKLSCSSDFLSRVGEVATRGRMSTPNGGTAPAPAAAQPVPMTLRQDAPMTQAPANYSDKDIEQLVQLITDQIIAASR